MSVDVNSLLKDDTASGPLLRGDTFVNNNLNGIYIRGQVGSGLAEATNATNTTFAGQTYVLDDPYPYLLTTRLDIGDQLEVETAGVQDPNPGNNSFFVNPGMLVKFQRGAGVLDGTNVPMTNTSRSTLNIGDTTYISEFNSNLLINPSTSGFKANSALLAKALFTSFYDDAASTTYTDPISGVTRTVVAALSSVPNGAGTLQPNPGNANVPDASRWGGITIQSGDIGVINSGIFRYGGGAINTGEGTGTQHVLEVGGDSNIATGAYISVTNNTFTDDTDVPINLQPDSLQAGDPTRPLLTGDPFIRGNTFIRNDYNAVGVQGGTAGPEHPANEAVSDTWTGSDFTYLLRDTIVVGPTQRNSILPPTAGGLTTLPAANVTLTLQSTLPGTVLADGTVVPAPGIPLVIKMLTQADAPPTEADGVTPPPAPTRSIGAGPVSSSASMTAPIRPPRSKTTSTTATTARSGSWGFRAISRPGRFVCPSS